MFIRTEKTTSVSNFTEYRVSLQRLRFTSKKTTFHLKDHCLPQFAVLRGDTEPPKLV